MTPFWLTAFLDLPAADFEPTVRFWAAVTGSRVSAPRGEGLEFATLVPRDGDDYLRVQRLDAGPPRIHLDLHVGDARTAADRATGLGAREVADHGHVLMSSPAGVPFCFVTATAARRPAPIAWPGGRSLLDQVCLDVARADVEVEWAFWRDLTGWDLRRGDAEFSSLVRPPDQPLRLLLQEVDDDRSPATAHLDLAAEDRDAEVDRHVRLGARVERRHDDFTVLRDPARSAYCITDRDPDTGLLG